MYQFLPIFQIADLKVSNFAQNCQIGDLKTVCTFQTHYSKYMKMALSHKTLPLNPNVNLNSNRISNHYIDFKASPIPNFKLDLGCYFKSLCVELLQWHL